MNYDLIQFAVFVWMQLFVMLYEHLIKAVGLQSVCLEILLLPAKYKDSRILTVGYIQKKLYVCAPTGHFAWTTKNILYLFRVFRAINNYYCSPFFYSKIEDVKKELNSLKMPPVAQEVQYETNTILPRQYFSWERLWMFESTYLLSVW